MRRGYLFNFIVVLILSSVLTFNISYAKIVELNVIYTNDIHDHIRPGYSGQGGMPFVAGVVKALRTKVINLLVVDGGDITDKGDMVADYTDGEIMFSALQKIGYTVITIGNHDLDKGLDRLCELKRFAPSVEVVATNWKEALNKCLKPWVIIELEGYKVGFIGMVKLEGSEDKVINSALDFWNDAINELKKQGCNFIIALCHLSSNSCLKLAEKFPDVDLFVSAHTHELLRKEKVSEKTKAIVVQAGMYALWVGHIKLKVDTEQGRVVSYENRIIDLKHDEVPLDEDFAKWVKAEEERVCPIASKYLIENGEELNSSQIGILASLALKEKSKADIALFHPRLLVRSTLPKGKLDYNAIYTTAGHRAKEIGIVVLKGEDIKNYFEDLVRYGWGRTVWTGINGEYISTFPPDKVTFKCNLDLDKNYTVALSKREWDNRLKRSLLKNGYEENNLPEFRMCDFTYFDAVSEFVEKIAKEGKRLDTFVNFVVSSSQDEESTTEE